MKKILKVGLVGLMTHPFRGDKETQYSQSAQALRDLSKQLNFELVVIPDGIYTAEQAQAAADQLANQSVDFVLIQASSFSGGAFIYPFTKLETRLGLWGVPEGAPTAEGGLPLNSFTAVNMYNSIIKTYLTGYKQPVKWFFGRVSDSLFEQRFRLTVQALTALVNLQGARIGLLGGVAPGFDNLKVDERDLLERLGIEVAAIEFDQVYQRAREASDEDVQRGKEALLKGVIRIDTGLDAALNKSASVFAAVDSLVKEHNLDAVAISCWPRFQESMQVAVCSVVGALNASGLVAACEGDLTSAVSMLALSYLNQSAVVTLMDLVTIDDQDDSLLLWHCGPTAPQLADEGGVFVRSLWLMEGDKGDKVGMANDLVLAPGEATIFGFTPDFSHVLVIKGTLDNQKPGYRGSRAWMRDLQINEKKADMRDVIETILASGYQHHYPLVFGNCSAAALELAAWLNIHPIPLHPYQDGLFVECDVC